MIVFDLLTGFLGSGKTTLLNAFLKTGAGADTAVIVNEFGAIGLDQLLYKELSEDVYLLDSGCLCCTVTHSLRETLLEIKNISNRLGRPPLQRVVIETTGLADPLPVLHALLGDKTLMPHFRLGQVITTVDAVQGAAQLAQHMESRRQASVAEHLVITKTDMATPAQLQAIKQQLRQINPRAQVTESVDGQAAASVFSTAVGDRSLQLLPTATPFIQSIAGPRSVLSHSSGSDIGSWSTFTDIRPTWVGIAAWWNLLVLQFGNQLLRCKGLLSVNDARPFVLIQGVGKVFHSPTFLPTWPDADPRGRIVCIGANLDPVWLQASLRALTITEASARPRNLTELNDCF
jgi:G3E family GTPase